MSTINAPPPTIDLKGLIPYRFNVRQFLTIIGAGVFPKEVRLELLGGAIVKKRTQHPPHNFTVLKLGQRLRSLLNEDWFVSEAKPVVLGPHWRPEPALAVIRRPREPYWTLDPEVSDLALLIEVAETSGVTERWTKRQGYATAGIAFYWIVDLDRRQVACYANPTGQGEWASYRDQECFRDGNEIPVVIEGVEVGRVPVSEVLPPRLS